MRNGETIGVEALSSFGNTIQYDSKKKKLRDSISM